MLKVTTDKEIDAKYILLRNTKVHETKPINDWLIVDYDKKGNVIGLEILGASKKMPSVSVFDGMLSVGYRVGKSAKKGAEVVLGEESKCAYVIPKTAMALN